VDSATPRGKTIVLCAVEFERQALRRAGIDKIAVVICTGPGPEAVIRFAERHGEHEGLVILAGLAGALRPSLRPGQARMIGSVIGDDGRRFSSGVARDMTATMMLDISTHATAAAPLAVIASSPLVISTVDAKRALAARSGADLVDQESGAFALAASVLGWRWIIVKGVSDGHDAQLPSDVDCWVDSAGRLRPARAAMAIALRPWNAARMLRLGRDAKAAMLAVAAIVHQLITKSRGDAADPLLHPASPSNATMP
jgi:hypothetical protein